MKHTMFLSGEIFWEQGHLPTPEIETKGKEN